MRSKNAVILLVLIMVVALLSSGCILNGLFNRRPMIEEISDQIRKIGQEFIYQVIAYDPDNDELTYSLTEKPEGMQIESTTGLINWIPGEAQIGTFIVEVKVSDGSSFDLQKFGITVKDICLTSIEAFPDNISIGAGNSNIITSITAHYDDGGSIDLSLADCDYSSSNTNIATVNNNGLITGVSTGTAIITISYTEGGITKADMIGVTVSEAPKILTSVTVLPSTMSMYVGDSENITSITAHYNDGSSTSIGLGSAIYSSNNPGVASVNTTGGVTGISAGTTIITISYTEDSITETDTVSVTIEDISLASITVLPSTMTIKKGQSQTINSITAYYNNASSANIELSACNYQSNVTNVTVTNGVIKVSSTCAATTAIITVSYTEGGVTKSDTVNVTITGGG